MAVKRSEFIRSHQKLLALEKEINKNKEGGGGGTTKPNTPTNPPKTDGDILLCKASGAIKTYQVVIVFTHASSGEYSIASAYSDAISISGKYMYGIALCNAEDGGEVRIQIDGSQYALLEEYNSKLTVGCPLKPVNGGKVKYDSSTLFAYFKALEDAEEEDEAILVTFLKKKYDGDQPVTVSYDEDTQKFTVTVKNISVQYPNPPNYPGNLNTIRGHHVWGADPEMTDAGSANYMPVTLVFDKPSSNAIVEIGVGNRTSWTQITGGAMKIVWREVNSAYSAVTQYITTSDANTIACKSFPQIRYVVLYLNSDGTYNLYKVSTGDGPFVILNELLQPYILWIKSGSDIQFYFASGSIGTAGLNSGNDGAPISSNCSIAYANAKFPISSCPATVYLILGWIDLNPASGTDQATYPYPTAFDIYQNRANYKTYLTIAGVTLDADGNVIDVEYLNLGFHAWLPPVVGRSESVVVRNSAGTGTVTLKFQNGIYMGRV